MRQIGTGTDKHGSEEGQNGRSGHGRTNMDEHRQKDLMDEVDAIDSEW